jgi:hypothetical protein
MIVTTPVCVVCFFSSFRLVSLFTYSGRSVARQQLLATSLRLDNRARLGAGAFLRACRHVREVRLWRINSRS